MVLCLTCGLQRPNKYKTKSCPRCNAYLKYVEAPAKATAFKLHRAGISVSYATAEVYSYNSCAVHTVNVVICVAHPYQAVVFRELPDGYGYVLPHKPLQAYGLLRYEVPYLDRAEAKTVLKRKLKELDAWVDKAVADGWLSICNLGGLL